MLLRSIRSRLIGLVVASVVPFTALIGVGLWNQWRTDQRNAVERSVSDARLIATQVDDHLNNLKNLLSGLSVAVSADPQDTAANDRLLRRVKAELPPYIANLNLFALDGTNIGTSSNAGRFFAGDRSYVQQIVEGREYALSGPIRARVGHAWVVAVARPVVDANGELRAVLTSGTWLEQFQDALNTTKLPPDSVVRIVDENLTVIAHSADGPNWINRDLSQSPAVISALQRWPRHQRSGPLVGRCRTHHRIGACRAGAMDGLGRLAGGCRLCRGDVAAGRGFELHAGGAPVRLRHRLDAVP